MLLYTHLDDRLGLLRCLVLLLCLGSAGCSTIAARNVAVATGLAAGTYIPGANLEQIYYLGVFDPQEQLPPSIYRVRVRGQASFFNNVRYASGWVPSALIDALGSSARFDSNSSNKGPIITKATEEETKLTGRRLVMFGPEGFREAPKDSRLVIAMGSSPEKFFNAVDQALGVVAQVTQGNTDPQLERGLFKELLRLKSERERLEDLHTESKAEIAKGGE